MKNKYLLISIICLTFAQLTQCMSEKPEKNPDEMLFEGAKNFDIELIKSALEKGANVNVQNDENRITALMFISSAPRWDTINIKDKIFTSEQILNIIKLLLDANADPNIQDRYKYTPLMRAVLNNNLKIVTALLQAGADLNLINLAYRTALDLANEQVNKKFDLSHLHNLSQSQIDLTERNSILIKKMLQEEPARRKMVKQQTAKMINETSPLIPELADIVSEYACPS